MLLPLFLIACATAGKDASRMERVVIAPDERSFVYENSGEPFVPWGVNYGNEGRLMEDFWEEDWKTLAEDFQEIKALGGNLVRIHLQFGKFMRSPDEINEKAFTRLQRLLATAEQSELYVDITGLACYRPSDVPAWYDALNEQERWRAQAAFWRAVASHCAGHPAVFCYNLMNEPISPAGKRETWSSGNLFGEYDFVQYIALEPDGRSRGEIAVDWIKTLTAAIREEDSRTPITVGLLPWVTGWKHLSGFVPSEIAPHLDFISVHICPKKDNPEEARTALRECAFGKPVVIEETFPLHCDLEQLEDFLEFSRDIACGWVWHYDGTTIAEYDARKRAGELTLPQAIWQQALQAFVRLGPEFKEWAPKRK